MGPATIYAFRNTDGTDCRACGLVHPFITQDHLPLASDSPSWCPLGDPEPVADGTRVAFNATAALKRHPHAAAYPPRALTVTRSWRWWWGLSAPLRRLWDRLDDAYWRAVWPKDRPLGAQRFVCRGRRTAEWAGDLSPDERARRPDHQGPFLTVLVYLSERDAAAHNLFCDWWIAWTNHATEADWATAEAFVAGKLEMDELPWTFGYHSEARMRTLLDASKP